MRRRSDDRLEEGEFFIGVGVGKGYDIYLFTVVWSECTVPLSVVQEKYAI
jgi:hypothetical protein